MEYINDFCDKGDSYALLNLSSRNQALVLSTAYHAMSFIDNPPTPYTIPIAKEIINTLETPPPHGSQCKFRGLRWKGDSCYLDSTLVALLAVPTEFVTTHILHTPLYHRKKGESLKTRECIQNELVKITESIRGGKKIVKDCTGIRHAFRTCSHIENYHRGGQREAGEFLSFLLSQFNTDIVHSQTTVYGTNDLTSINPVIKTKTSTTKYNDSSIIVFVEGRLLQNSFQGFPVSIGSFLTQTEDNIIHDSTSFKRYITVKSIKSSPFLIFQIQRIILERVHDRRGERLKEKILDTPVLPTQTVTTGNGENLHLTAIVVLQSGHYTVYIRCGLMWYHYNDLSRKIRTIGSYSKMLRSSPDPLKYSTLCFYSKQD